MDNRKNIYNNINLLENHNDIIIFIKQNNIEYTENNNGIYINISILSDELISELNTLIIDLIEYEKTKDDMYKLNEIKVELTNKKDTNPIMMKKKLKLTKSQVDRLNNIKA